MPIPFVTITEQKKRTGNGQFIQSKRKNILKCEQSSTSIFQIKYLCTR